MAKATTHETITARNADVRSESTSMKDLEDVSNEQGLSEGTYHQKKVDMRPKREHFFSPLDSALSKAVHKDAEQVDYTEAEEVDAMGQR